MQANKLERSKSFNNKQNCIKAYPHQSLFIEGIGLCQINKCAGSKSMVVGTNVQKNTLIVKTITDKKPKMSLRKIVDTYMCKTNAEKGL